MSIPVPTTSVRGRPAPFAFTVGLTTLAGAIGFACLWIGGTAPWRNPATAAVLLVFGLAIALGEVFTVVSPGYRELAPMGTAAAFGLAFTVEVPFGTRPSFGTHAVIAVATLAIILGASARSALGRPVRLLAPAGRVVAVAVAAILYRSLYLSQPIGQPAPPDGLSPWKSSVIMLLVAIVALFVEGLISSMPSLRRGIGAWWHSVAEDLRTSAPISAALAVTGTMIALGAGPLGLWALPLFLIPLVLTLFAFRRFMSIQATYLQSIRTLARLTDVAGYTSPHHSERVAALAVEVAQHLGLSAYEVLNLEYAALLHDIGQVGLVDPIPGGATVLAAPADQRRIADHSVDIVRATGVLDEAAHILEHQTTPYRQMRELDEQIPLQSRILKVVNAYVDLTPETGTRGPRAARRSRSAAIERIHLGLGYEYDPEVVDALVHVVEGRHGRAS